jgi:hypothetical protein
MKPLYKLGFCLLCLFYSLQVYSQTDSAKEEAKKDHIEKVAEKDLTAKAAAFKTAKEVYEKELKTLLELTNSLDLKVPAQLTKVRSLKTEADAVITQAEVLHEYYLLKGVDKTTLNTHFDIPTGFKGTPPNLMGQTPKEPTTFMLLGEDNIFLKNDITKDDKKAKILNEILKEDSKIHLGDFWIPKDGAEIPVIFKCNGAMRKKMGKDNCEEKNKELPRYLKFKKIDLEIFEGNLVDIKVYLEGNGHVYLFENARSASLLRFTKQANWFTLRNRVELTYKEPSDDYAGYELKLADVLRYFSNSGRNFIPDDQTLAFPEMIDGEKANLENSNIYELHQNSSLSNVLDLRTYTDFLGLFGESPNGIAQIEGHASFFVIPSRLRGTSLSIFKKIKPYVSYARLDENDRQLIPERVENSGTENQNRFKVENGLDILQKSYLDLGVKIDVLSFKIKKEYPFEINTYGIVRYQIADLDIDPFDEPSMETPEITGEDITPETTNDDITAVNDNELNNYKAFGIGAGINFDFRRFRNFTFSHSIEYTRYNVNSINRFDNFINPENFWVFRNESDIAYHTGKQENNAIFVRLKVFDNKNPNVDSNFFQFQFGYKFSLGLQKVQAKN